MTIQTQYPFFLRALGLLAALLSPLDATAAIDSAGSYALVLNGKTVAYLSSVEGSGASAEVVSQSIGPAPFPKKHLGEMQNKDWTLKLGVAPEGELLNWIQASLQSGAYPAQASIVMVDRRGNEIRRATLADAVISEIAIPALDRTSRERLQITLKLRPSYVTWQKGKGAPYVGPERGAIRSRMLKSNFRLEIDGLDMSRVLGVGALTIKRTQREEKAFREYEYLSRGWEVSDLNVVVPEAFSDGMIDWHQDFVLAGNSADSKERKGVLTLLDTDQRTPVLSIGLDHVGIHSVDYGFAGSNEDSRLILKAGLYVETISLEAATP